MSRKSTIDWYQLFRHTLRHAKTDDLIPCLHPFERGHPAVDDPTRERVLQILLTRVFIPGVQLKLFKKTGRLPEEGV